MRETRETVQIHAYSYIQQSGCSVKSMNAKNPKKNHRFMGMRTGT